MKRLLLLLALLFTLPAWADVQTFQVTIGSGTRTPIVASGAQFVCAWVLFQNNQSHNMRIGDTSTSATKGIQLMPNAWFYIPQPPGPPTTTRLTAWYVAGTPGDVIDVTCESGQ